MGKFVVLYRGGEVAETPQDRERVMQAWMAWFGSLGPSVTDMGNPLAAAMTVTSHGAADATSDLGGYSIIAAESLSDAAAAVRDCPVLHAGGTVEVHEALAM